MAQSPTKGLLPLRGELGTTIRNYIDRDLMELELMENLGLGSIATGTTVVRHLRSRAGIGQQVYHFGNQSGRIYSIVIVYNDSSSGQAVLTGV